MTNREPPPMKLPALSSQEIERAKRDSKHHRYWAYGRWAGGWRLDFGMYEGERIRDVPFYDYLKFCKNHSRSDRANFHYALHKYTIGLKDQARTRPSHFRVPLSGEYFGRCIGKCSKGYLRWLLNSKPKTEEEEERYELFYAAVRNFLKFGDYESDEAIFEEIIKEGEAESRSNSKFYRQETTESKSNTQLLSDNGHYSPNTGLPSPKETPVRKQHASDKKERRKESDIPSKDKVASSSTRRKHRTSRRKAESDAEMSSCSNKAQNGSPRSYW